MQQFFFQHFLLARLGSQNTAFEESSSNLGKSIKLSSEIALMSLAQTLKPVKAI